MEENPIGKAFDLEGAGDFASAEELLRSAVALGADGAELSLGGFLRRQNRDAEAVEVFRSGEAAGDLRCLTNLALLFEDNGEDAQAERAYMRADALGFAVGSYGLGRLLYARGDVSGSIAANRRAADLGDGDGAHNLGFLLSETGDSDGAFAAYKLSSELGCADGTEAYGRLLATRGSLAQAEEVLRSASGAGHPGCAFELGVVLYDQGRSVEALAEFRRAASLGHSGADNLAESLEHEISQAAKSETSAVASGDDAVRATYGASLQLLTAVARSRSLALASQEAVASARREYAAKLQALDAELEVQKRELNDLLRRAEELQPARQAAPTGSTANCVERMPDGRWKVRQEMSASFSTARQAASAALTDAQTKWTGKAGNLARAQASARQAVGIYKALELARHEIDVERGNAGAAQAAQASESQQQLSDEIFTGLGQIERANAELPLSMRAFGDPAWQSIEPGHHSCELSLAGWLMPLPDPALGTNERLHADVRVPFLLDTSTRQILYSSEAERVAAQQLIQGLLLRRLAVNRPGDIQFHIFDPVGLGQSVTELLPLADHDQSLLGGKVWSRSEDLRRVMEELAAHIEMVVQKYLRSDYETLDDFNAEAGEIAEPRRVVAIFGLPKNIDDETAANIQRVVLNGDRCGVNLLLAQSIHEPSFDWPSSQPTLSLASPLRQEADAYSLQLGLMVDEAGQGNEAVRILVDKVGAASATQEAPVLGAERLLNIYNEESARGMRSERQDSAAPISLDDDLSWWTGSSAKGISVPIGQRGARETAVLTLDSGDRSGALLVGRPGSGKSTLLHSFILGATAIYPPEELELYLIDFKEGVEFKGYAAEQLPHARCVAVETDPEFGLSVLRALDEEISRRGSLLRSTGGEITGLEGLRATSGEPVPRTIMVFDEFHVLFAKNDRMGMQAAELLEKVIRQGRAFGIHVILGSQTLSGMDALDANILQLLPVRILLAASEVDQRKVLRDGNNAGQYLNSRGEALLNEAQGAEDANQPFQAAFIAPEERMVALKRQRALADARGFLRKPMVFDSNQAALVEDTEPTDFVQQIGTHGAQPLKIRVGASMAIHGNADINLRREEGGNILLVARATESSEEDTIVPRGVPLSQLSMTLTSLSASAASIQLVDLLPIDAGVEEHVAALGLRQRVPVIRSRRLPGVVSSLLDEVRSRTAEDDLRAPPVVLVLFGVDRARALDASGAGLDGDEELTDQLEELLRDGPLVGVHVWAWASTTVGLARRLSSSAIREFAWRIGGKMSSEDSEALLESSVASSLKDAHVAIANDSYGIQKRAVCYEPPTLTWLTNVRQAFEEMEA